MKKVLWIACLLCMMPFLGYAQKHAGLATAQDDKADFGQPLVSKELPASIQLEGIKAGGNTRTWSAHGMFVPAQNYNYGRYYTIDQDGTVHQVAMYNDWYYSSAEYCSVPTWTAQTTEPELVWGYANDYVEGFSKIDFDNGEGIGIASISLSMNDLTYDYNKDRMLGTKDGYIYEISKLSPGGIQRTLYNPTQHNNIKPIAIAADLNGDLYFVSLSTPGQVNSKLYKITWKADGTLNTMSEGIEISPAWPAKRIQTMAFDHATGILYWWQCKDGNSGFANFGELDKVTAEFEAKNAQPLSTGLAGLFFQFDYVEHNVACIDTEEALKIVVNPNTGNTNANLVRTKDFLPGKTVTITYTDPTCRTLDTVFLINRDTHEVFDTIYPNEFVGTTKRATFTMPVFNVDIDGEWSGNVHTITTNVTPSSLPKPTTNPANQAECGETVSLSVAHPEGYVLYELKKGSTVMPLVNYATSFTMPDQNVTIGAKYKSVVVGDIADICQYNKIAAAPTTTSVTNYQATHVKFYVGKVNGSSTINYTMYTKQQLQNKVWDVAGTYSYYAQYDNGQYGAYVTAKKTFTVYSAPATLGIVAESQYCCVDGEIILKASDTTLTGTFQWTKGGVVIDETDVPFDTIRNIATTDAGYYKLTYIPTNADQCEVTSIDSVAINVATLPNTPVVVVQGGSDTVCYNSSAILAWAHGVLNPLEYTYRWYILDSIDLTNGEEFWTLIEGADDDTYETEPLTEPATYQLIINYAGDYSACASAPSLPKTVYVRENEPIQIYNVGNLYETCMGFAPSEEDELPQIADTYTDIHWYWDSIEPLTETSNVLHLGVEGIHPTEDILDQVGLHLVRVTAKTGEGCDLEGKFNVLIKNLPPVRIEYTDRNGQLHTATPDSPLTLEVCHGDIVELTAVGANTYEWGQVGSQPTNSIYQVDNTHQDTSIFTIVVLKPLSGQTEKWQVNGASDTTGCHNTASVIFNVNPLPEITWVNPAPTTDTIELSVLQETIQLEATPAGGIFSYIEIHQPDLSYPIDNGLLNLAELDALPTADSNNKVFQLIYSYEDANGCTKEERLHVRVIKPYWTDKARRDTMWFQNCLDAGRFEITNPAQLGAFAAYLNYDILKDEDKEGIEFFNFDTATVYITNNINLLEEPYFFRPLTNFAGVLDGTGKVIDSMVITEPNLVMEFNGMIRNLGIHDAKVTSVGQQALIDLPGTYHNSYFTNPDLNNVVFNLYPDGDVQNVYYYCERGDEIVSKYIGRRMTIEVNNQDTIVDKAPANPFYEYSLTQQIYEINQRDAQPAKIRTIQFNRSEEGPEGSDEPDVRGQRNETESTVRTWEVYLTTTTQANYEGANDYIPVNEAMKVFEGTIDLGTNGLVTLELDTPFEYDGNGNICLTIYDKTGDWTWYGSYFTATKTENAQTVCFYQDGTEINLTAPTASNVDYFNYVSDIRLGYTTTIDVTSAELFDGTTGLLEQWVWLKNDFAYRDWILDLGGNNYNYPVMNTSFEHHHYVYVNDFENGTYELGGEIKHRTIDDVTYDFAMNGDEITLELTPANDYIIIDSVTVTAVNYRTAGVDSVLNVTVNNDLYNFTMPADSLYDTAYYVVVDIASHKDYWIDDYNYDTAWYNAIMNGTQMQEAIEIHNNAELAAFARCISDGHYFNGDTIRIEGGDQPNSRFLDMAAHLWYPVIGFAGVLDGRGYIVDNIVVFEEHSAMFLDMDDEALIRNLGVQDIQMPEDSYVFDNWYEDGAHVLNSYVVNNPATGVTYELARDVTNMDNVYTLDENGSPVNQDGQGIDLDGLNAWVAANQNPTDPYLTAFMDWIVDDAVINYGYPIHSGNIYMPGLAIDYTPDVNAPVNNCYVSGPYEGWAGDQIEVNTYPAIGYDLTRLTVTYHLAAGDSTVSIIDTHKFTMLNANASVIAEFSPHEWTLNVFYKFEDGTTAATTYTDNHLHYNDAYEVISPEIPGYTPDRDTVTGTMPNGNKNEVVTYIANWYHVVKGDEPGLVAVNVIPTGDSAQYNTTATVVVELEPGLSIDSVWVTSDCQEVEDVVIVPNALNTIQFTMPMCDATVHVNCTEEFWTDYGIRDISWYLADTSAMEYTLTTDSMLGGLSALVSGLCGVDNHGFEVNDEPAWLIENPITFDGKVIKVVSAQEPNEINLIEHKWKPIGAQLEYTAYFQGTFNGKGVHITNMRTKDMRFYDGDLGEGSCQAFFGNIGADGVVTDLNIQGKSEGRYFTAGIAGVNYGTIVNSVADVTVESEFEAGGVAANNMGLILNTYCIAPYVMSTASAKGTNNYYVGGIASYNEGQIENCHTITKLRKGPEGYNPINYYGAIVGFNKIGNSGPVGNVSYCYYADSTFSVACSNANWTDHVGTLGSNTTSVLNNHAAELNPTSVVALYSWINGAGYPVFGDIIGRDYMDINNVEVNAVVFPNPTRDVVRIQSNNIERITVFNMFGQQIMDQEVNGNEAELNLNGHAAGVYMIRIATSEGVVVRNVVLE